MSSVDSIIAAWKKKDFKPIYWFEGEEDYFIDTLIHYAEHHILSEAEAGFNLTIFYGKDTLWSDLLNACMRYPMFAERQVVILKEAQHWTAKDFEKLEPYFKQPLTSTILVVGHKEKKVDGRSSFGKLLANRTVLFTTTKIKDYELSGWVEKMVRSKGFEIDQRALALLVDHIGNDLSRLHTEIEKIAVNLGERKKISDQDIEQYVGVSREFNTFEFTSAIAAQDLPKALRIIQYFESNPKAAPIQLILPSLYGFFARMQMIYSLSDRSERNYKQALNLPFPALKDYANALRCYSADSVDKSLLLLADYNLKSVGLNNVGKNDAELLKEMVVKIMAG